MRLLGPLLLLAACSAEAPERPDTIAPGDYTYARQLLTFRITELMEEHRLPGFSVALINDQDTVWEQTFGVADVERGTPMKLATRFKLGSIAKVFTALEIMRLVEEDRVELDAPVTSYVPDFTIRTRFPDARPITIRDLLTHRSGLPRNGNLPTWYWDAGQQVLRDLARSVHDSYTAFPPGQRFKYSNLGYVLLGQVIDAMRGGGFPYHMERELLRPIGMRDSVFLKQRLPEGEPVALGYAPSDDGPTPLNQSDIIGMPSGNLYGTLGDLARFVKFLFRGGDDVIRAETLASMYEVQHHRPEDPQELGLCWFTERRALGEKIVFHSGICQGTYTFLAFLPDRKLGAIMTANSTAFVDQAPRAVFEALELMREAKCGVATHDRFAGKYIAEGEVIEFRSDEGELCASGRGHDLDLTRLNGSRYLLEHWLIDIGQLDVEFFPDHDMLLLTVEGSYRITCPRYPEIEAIPPLWHKLAGKYSIRPRVKSTYWESEDLGRSEITIADQVLLMPALKAALWPLSDTEILLMGGAFDGETMVFDPETGEIARQHVVYVPSRD